MSLDKNQSAIAILIEYIRQDFNVGEQLDDYDNDGGAQMVG